MCSCVVTPHHTEKEIKWGTGSLPSEEGERRTQESELEMKNVNMKEKKWKQWNERNEKSESKRKRIKQLHSTSARWQFCIQPMWLQGDVNSKQENSYIHQNEIAKTEG